MRKVKLFGRFLKFIAEVHIPSFSKAPDVLVWGGRVFVWNSKENQYIEAEHAYWIPEEFAAPEAPVEAFDADELFEEDGDFE